MEEGIDVERCGREVQNGEDHVHEQTHHSQNNRADSIDGLGIPLDKGTHGDMRGHWQSHTKGRQEALRELQRSPTLRQAVFFFRRDSRCWTPQFDSAYAPRGLETVGTPEVENGPQKKPEENSNIVRGFRRWTTAVVQTGTLDGDPNYIPNL